MENQSESNTLVEDDYGNPETDEPTGVLAYLVVKQLNFHINQVNVFCSQCG